ncbi:beta-N-acetylglucosaminidase domain-containing protein [Bacillus sp. AFS053548]|uniref:beta-N-acetylglucosaminidase domain-containing protein n=1 Tax=Bacillus sp. AFS053548 TaxID=2033505 RepID=UPI001145B7F0|nr:beta-N-acetylglucosaminidase domain-containing protein [Bacillus sp. AFS053548]
MSNRKLIKKVLSVCLVTGLCAPLTFQVTKAESNNENYDFTISPTPKSIEKTGNGFPLNPKVGIVTENDTDEMAVLEVKEALKKAGVKKIIERDINDPLPNAPVIIWVGEFKDKDELNRLQENVDIQDFHINHKEGYIVSSGKSQGSKKDIVIAGNDAAGTFYGAETFKHIILEREGTDWIPEVEIRDWPTMPIRGTIEGFYGEPWSHEDRLSQLDFYGEHKMNSYIYAPKDDPYHREKWKEPYPQGKVSEIEQLVKSSQKNHVDFTFAISPGNTITYSSDADLQALINKAQAMWDIGVRSFALYLDDISTTLSSPQDRAMFGKDANPAAAAQAYLLNRFNDQFIKTHEGAERLITVPTEYYQANTSPYRKRFAELVQADIVVQWTGIGVVAPSITSADADKIHGIFNHDLLIWDNYPVNDFDRNRLFLGPLVGRDVNLTPEHGVIGLTANPMNEAEASKISLFTVADYTWNPEAYDPNASLEQSLKEFAGDASEVLQVFVESSYSSSLNNNKEPYSEKLKTIMEQFWSSYEAKAGQEGASVLLQEFIKLKNTPSKLRETLDNQNFLNEIDPYLNKMELYGIAGEAAIKMLLAEQENNFQVAAEQRLLLKNTMTEIAKIPQKLSLGVIPNFLDRAINGVNLAEGKIAKASSSEVSWLTPDLAVDGNNSTRWASLYTNNQWISVDLGKLYSINKVVLNWESAYGKQYKIQVSQDGNQWTDIYTELNGNGGTDEIEFNSIDARYVKMQGLSRATSWGYSLYEIKVFETRNY